MSLIPLFKNVNWTEIDLIKKFKQMIFKYFIFTKIYSIFLGVVKVFILINSILKKIVTSTPIFSGVNETEIDLIK